MHAWVSHTPYNIEVMISRYYEFTSIGMGSGGSYAQGNTYIRLNEMNSRFNIFIYVYL